MKKNLRNEEKINAEIRMAKVNLQRIVDDDDMIIIIEKKRQYQKQNSIT